MKLNHLYLHDKGRLLELIEEMYNFWKRHQRFSVIHSGSGNALQDLSFVQADSNFNNLILAVYRSLEEEIMDEKIEYIVRCRLVRMRQFLCRI